MAELTTGRRSALLQRLMREMERKQAHTGNRTGGEAALRGLAMKLQQNKIEELQEQEKASAKTQGASEAALLSAMNGGGAQDFSGRPIVDEAGVQKSADPQAQLSQLLTQHPDSQLGQMAAQMQMQQSMAGQKPPRTAVEEIEIDDKGTVESRLINLDTGDTIKVLGSGLKRQPSTTISMPAEESEFRKAMASGQAERVNQMNTEALKSTEMDNDLDQVQLAIANGASTGGLAEFALPFQRFAVSQGLELEGVSEKEMIQRVSNQMALVLRNPDSGLGLTGSTSNKDLEFLKQSVVGLGRTREGNLMMVDAMKRVNERKRAVFAEAERLIMENDGVPPPGFNLKLVKFAKGYEIYTPEERQAIEAISKLDGDKDDPLGLNGMFSETATGKTTTVISDEDTVWDANE